MSRIRDLAAAVAPCAACDDPGCRLARAILNVESARHAHQAAKAREIVLVPLPDDGPEPPGVLTIRRAVESSASLALDSESDREALIFRLAHALGLA